MKKQFYFRTPTIPLDSLNYLLVYDDHIFFIINILRKVELAAISFGRIAFSKTMKKQFYFRSLTIPLDSLNYLLVYDDHILFYLNILRKVELAAISFRGIAFSKTMKKQFYFRSLTIPLDSLNYLLVYDDHILFYLNILRKVELAAISFRGIAFSKTMKKQFYFRSLTIPLDSLNYLLVYNDHILFYLNILRKVELAAISFRGIAFSKTMKKQFYFRTPTIPLDSLNYLLVYDDHIFFIINILRKVELAAISFGRIAFSKTMKKQFYFRSLTIPLDSLNYLLVYDDHILFYLNILRKVELAAISFRGIAFSKTMKKQFYFRSLTIPLDSLNYLLVYDDHILFYLNILRKVELAAISFRGIAFSKTMKKQFYFRSLTIPLDSLNYLLVYNDHILFYLNILRKVELAAISFRGIAFSKTMKKQFYFRSLTIPLDSLNYLLVYNDHILFYLNILRKVELAAISFRGIAFSKTIKKQFYFRTPTIPLDSLNYLFVYDDPILFIINILRKVELAKKDQSCVSLRSLHNNFDYLE
ncbi:hypothetical protein [Enterococcus sp. AZ109]|uniref:hypothetical protein n=1 Tax=Enterococcus sp. AZ109 TaxID=2774634 RepID=UPI003F220FA5